MWNGLMSLSKVIRAPAAQILEHVSNLDCVKMDNNDLRELQFKHHLLHVGGPDMDQLKSCNVDVIVFQSWFLSL